MSKKGKCSNGFAKSAALSLLALSIAMSVSISPAMAATTWLPEFSPEKSVYVDPALKADAVAPVDLSALPPKLAAEAAKNNLKVFVVMAKKGDESVGTCKDKFAVCKLEELMGKWNSRLPQDDYVLLLVVRSDTDWTKVSYAANLGNRPRGFGVGPTTLNLEKWAKGTNGGVAYLPRDPGNFALHVVADINALMDKAKSDAAAKKAQAEFMADLPGYIMLGGSFLCAIALGVFLSLRYGKERAKALAAVENLKGVLEAANTNYIQIQDSYLDFLSEQGDDWKTKFQGKTLTSYTAAVSDYADLSARISAANDRLSQAEKQFASGNVLTVAGFREAYRILTEEPVVVTGDSLPLNERSLFSSEVQADTYSPAALLENMDRLFQNTSQALSGIMEAFTQAQSNSQEVGKVSGEVRGLIEQLADCQVSTDSYKGRLQQVLLATQGVQAIIQKDPLSASADSSRLRDAAQAISADIRTALGLVQALTVTDKALASALAQVKARRLQSVNYAYPGSDTPAQAASTYLLAEDGYNPDVYAKQAEEAILKSRSALEAAQLSESARQKEEAERLAAESIKVIQVSLEAQSYVTTTAGAIATTLNQLNEELPDAEAALATLKSEFLPVNYGKVEGNAAAALKLASDTVNHLAQIKRAYFEQRFVGSSKQLAQVKGNIQSGRDALLEIHNTLASLRNQRTAARDTSAQIQLQLPKIASRLQETAFTTAAKTDETFRRLSEQANGLAQQVAAVKADWVKCEQQTKEVLAALASEVSQALESQLSAYNQAKAEFADCERLYLRAETVVSDSRVRQSAAQKRDSARQAMALVEAGLNVAKSDWFALGQSLNAAKQSIEEAQAAAKLDINRAEDAERDIARAASRINDVPSSFGSSRSIGGSYQSFGSGVYADTSSAQSQLRSAESAYQRKEYEEASRLADAAKNAAESAQDEAERQVQQQIDAAVSVWEEQERQRRASEAEAERQRRAEEEEADRQRRDAEDAQRRASESSSSSGSFGGDSDGNSGSFGGGDF